MDAEILENIKIEIRETEMPFFDDSTIEYHYNKNHKNVNDTIYALLILKSEATTLNISGLVTNDTSAYFMRLASRFKKFNSGTLR